MLDHNRKMLEWRELLEHEEKDKEEEKEELRRRLADIGKQRDKLENEQQTEGLMSGGHLSTIN